MTWVFEEPKIIDADAWCHHIVTFCHRYEEHDSGSRIAPYLPRYTPAHDFPPPGSDLRRHGSKNMTANEPAMPRSVSVPGQLSRRQQQATAGQQPDFQVTGNKVGEGNGTRRFRTTFDGGTTSSAYRDFGILG